MSPTRFGTAVTQRALSHLPLELGISTIGMYRTLSGYALLSNAPAALGQAMGGAGYPLMCILMIWAAGSTLDSAFAILS